MQLYDTAGALIPSDLLDVELSSTFFEDPNGSVENCFDGQRPRAAICGIRLICTCAAESAAHVPQGHHQVDGSCAQY